MENGKKKIESCAVVNERILITRFQIKRGHMTVIGIYDPEGGIVDGTVAFYETVQRNL